MNMKKFLIAAGVVVAFGLYIVFAQGLQNKQAAGPAAVQTPPAPSGVTTTADQPSGTPPPQGNPTPQPAPTPAPAGLYKDGSYTGTAVDAFYGTLQVKTVIQGGKLADVQFLKYPDSPGHTTEVSN